MTEYAKTWLSPVAQQCRRVAVALIAGPWPGKNDADIASKLDELPKHRQVGIVAGVLLTLFLFSLFAAQFGLVGLALYFLAVILVVS